MKKDIEWLKEEVYKILRDKVADGINYYDYMGLKRSLNELIDQLDEPEVLSQEWIDEHSDGPIRCQYVWVDYLKELLVPKQELPVIPKYVAEYLEYAKKHYSLIQMMEKASVIGGWTTMKKEFDWISANDETFARAWLDGYEVEEEHKYYVLNSGDVPLLKRVGNQIQRTTTELSIYEKGRDNSRFKLTEKEIKDYDERYWAFRKPV